MEPFDKFDRKSTEESKQNDVGSKLFFDAFDPPKNRTKSSQPLPADDRPEREEFVVFLYNLARKHDLNKHTWSHKISTWLGNDESSYSGREALNWKSIQRAERDPSLTEKEHKWLGIVERNYDTFRYLNSYDIFNSGIIDAASIEPIRSLTPDSERDANVAKQKALYFGRDADKSALQNYDQNIKPKIQQLVNELKTEPTDELLALANKGDANAQYECSKYYLEGVKSYGRDNELSALDLEQLQKALPWLYAAARQGQKDALYSLASEITEDGFIESRGFTKSAQVVKAFFEHEGRKGDKLAQHIFEMLHVGNRNEVAAQLFEKAAEQGDHNAVEMLGQMVKGLNQYGLPLRQNLSVEAQERYVKALEHLAGADTQNANDKSRTEAMVSLGEIYELGVTGKKDYGRAEAFYRRAAELGNKEAQLHMGIINYQGVVVEPDLVESAKWFQKAHDVVDWQLTQLLNHRMGCGSPAIIFDGAREWAKTLESEEARASVLSKLHDTRLPYDMKMIKFAKNAAKTK